MARIAITARNFADLSPDAVALLQNAGHEVTLFPDGMAMTPRQYRDAIADADAVIVSLERFDRALLEQLPNLRLISRRGVGVDSIDMDACREMGISVARTLGQVESSVAEYAIACVLYFARRLHEQNAPMHAHQWTRILTQGAKTRTIGLVGFGGIGTQIARRADALGMRVLCCARHRHPEEEALYHAQYTGFDALLESSDYVVAAVPLTGQTRGMFDARAFARMKPGAVFINVARAPVAVEEDLRAALLSGHLGGAALDVHPTEPCTDSPFCGMPNVLLTPHTAPYTQENFSCMNRTAAQNVVDFFAANPL